jgi:hypothetical protein
MLSGENWRPVAYASRSMSDTEKRYAKKKPWLQRGFAPKVHLRKVFIVETDHKPLVLLLNTKHLNDRLPRILQFLA